MQDGGVGGESTCKRRNREKVAKWRGRDGDEEWNNVVKISAGASGSFQQIGELYENMNVVEAEWEVRMTVGGAWTVFLPAVSGDD